MKSLEKNFTLRPDLTELSDKINAKKLVRIIPKSTAINTTGFKQEVFEILEPVFGPFYDDIQGLSQMVSTQAANFEFNDEKLEDILNAFEDTTPT
jgi:hypothetical protein